MSKIDCEVIVIGAGMAGLAAARTLHQQGRKVIILEARDRIGGRTWTLKQNGATLDMGASWIHGKADNPMVELAESIHSPLTADTQWEDSAVYNYNGERVDNPEQLYERWEEVIYDHHEWFLENKPDATIAMLADRARDSGDLDFLSAEYNAALLSITFELDWSADIADLSVQALEDSKEYLGGEPMLVDGYISIVEHLASGLNIDLNKAVSKLDYSGEQVQLTVGDDIYQANQVVVTVPLGVLKAGDIEFNPRLPDSKQQAFSAIGVGLLNKIWLEFSGVFWDDNEVISVVTQEKGRFNEWINFDKISGKPILLAFVAGRFADELEHCSDTDIVDRALDTLKLVYDDKVPDPVSFKISRWRQDTYAKGAYSYLPVGGRNENRSLLAETVAGKVFFAGEATASDYPSTTHGAYLSGIREAKKILGLY